MNKKFYFSFIIFLFVSTALNAQNGGNTRFKKDSLLNNITNIDKRLKRVSSKDISYGFSMPITMDTALNVYKLSDIGIQPERDNKGLLVLKNSWEPFNDTALFSDTIIIDPAFLPIIFDGKILPSKIDFLPKSLHTDSFRLIPRDSTFAPQLDKNRRVEEARRFYYMNNPLRIKLNALNFKNAPLPTENVEEKKNIFKDLLTTDEAIGVNTPEIEKYLIKPVYWLRNGEHSLQINQSGFSDNWYAGGNNNFNIMNYHKITLNYKKNKVSFNNTLEWKLNVQKTPADTLHKIGITDDYIRSYSVLGISAFKKWSYSINLEIKTPLFNSYPINQEKRRTAFLSPLQINSGLGMGYKYAKVSKKDKYRKIDLSVELSPISINYTFVGDNGDNGVDPTRFAVKAGEKSKFDLGSSVNLNLSCGFNRYSGFTSRLKYFTTYEKVILENESKFTMTLNRYLSTSIYLYIRYDDGVEVTKKDPKWSYFQYSEVVGFGLSYKW